MTIQDLDLQPPTRADTGFGGWAHYLARPSDPELLEAMTRELGNEARQLAQLALACVGRVAHETQWEHLELLREAGCRVSADVIQLPAKSLEPCYDYMLWLEGAVAAVDHVAQRRELVSGAGQLLHDCGFSVKIFVAATSAGQWNALELLHIGETELAWTTARAHMTSAVGDRARQALTARSAVESAPHVSRARLQLLASASDRIGPKVTAALQEHLALCDACAKAFRAISASTAV